MLKLYTKVNVNGNSYKLMIDNENKTYKVGYNVYMGKGDIQTTKQGIKEHETFLKSCGYVEV